MRGIYCISQAWDNNGKCLFIPKTEQILILSGLEVDFNACFTYTFIHISTRCISLVKAL